METATKEAPYTSEEQTGDRTRDTQVSKLLRLAEAAHLFNTPDNTQYAELPVGDHWETYQVGSMPVRDWLTNTYRKAYQGVPSRQALESTVEAMRAEARFDAPTQEVYLRVAWHGGTLYLDLGNADGEVVAVTAAGWQVLPTSPVKFRRPKSMQPLPHPVPGGNIDELHPFLNLSRADGDKDWYLVAGWLLGTLHPTEPYAFLTLCGEKGSAKTSTTRNLRGLIDPSVAPVPVQPKDSDSLTLKAHHNYVVAFDNMSSLPRWLSDGLCRLSTGAGDSKRAHYENTDEITFSAKRPCIINGIEELATAGDLLDRVVMVTLPTINPKNRKSERELTPAYEAARPRILGALLDAVVVALGSWQTTHLDSAPRMVDFAEWVTAGETAFGWKPGTFMAAYTSNQAVGVGLELEASPIGASILSLMENRVRWEGPASKLLKELREELGGAYPPFGWPGDAKRLSGLLERIAPSLRSVGIEFTRSRTSGARSITLMRVGMSSGMREPAEADCVTGGNDLHEHDASDAVLPLNPTFPLKEEEEEEEAGVGGKHRDTPSPASPAYVPSWVKPEHVAAYLEEGPPPISDDLPF